MDSQSRGGGFGARGRFNGRGGASVGRGGRGGASSNAKSNSSGSAAVVSKKKDVGPAEKYVVIITNVENDFAKVHQDRLASFLCLDPSHKGRAAKDGTNENGGDERAVAAAGCRFELVCRSETRSAELTVKGPADASVAAVFLPRRGAAAVAAAAAAKGKAAAAAAAAGATTTVTADISNDAAAVAITESLTAGHGGSSGGGSGSPVFDSLEEMALVLKDRPYFARPVVMRVNIPGKDSGAALPVSAACRRRVERSGGKTARAAATDDGSKKKGEKHPRTEEEKEEKKAARTTTSSSSDSDDNDNGKEAEAEEEERESKEVDESESRLLLRQYPFHQKDLVTAVAVISATQWTTKEVRHQLKDLPGFLTAWRLYAKHYRVVFEDGTALFRAKQLLDQFQLDGNVRVTLNLSDALVRQNADFLAKQEAAVDGENAV